MKSQVIEYKSAPKTVSQRMSVLDTSDKAGIACSWTGNVVYNHITGCYDHLEFTWNFDWTKLKCQGVDRLSGHIIVRPHTHIVLSGTTAFTDQKIDVDWKLGKETIIKDLTNVSYSQYNATFEYFLTPHYAPIEKKVLYNEMFTASDLNDTVLVIEGKKLHVSKAFLSYHSEFFRALFSDNFKEGQMAEIPIKEVSYEDFGLLMSTVYPDTVFPNDRTVEKLLKLADRFLMPSVTAHVEYHLLHNSNIPNEKMMWMADAYGMKALLEKCIKSMDTLEKAKSLKASPDYSKLSKDVKSIVLDKIMQLL